MGRAWPTSLTLALPGAGVCVYVLVLFYLAFSEYLFSQIHAHAHEARGTRGRPPSPSPKVEDVAGCGIFFTGLFSVETGRENFGKGNLKLVGCQQKIFF